jgi:tetratricopeptide (TPR) repeat protein
MWGTRAQGVTLVGLAAAASLVGGLALAQAPQNPFAGECNREATPEEVEGARGAHQAAKQFYERAEYARAIQYWRDVFRFDCNAIGTLLNIANAYERLGDRENAIFALETYVKRVPAGTDVSKIETRIQNLKELQAQAAASASAAASAAAPPPSATTPPPPPSATTPPIMVKPYGAAPSVVIGLGAAVMVAGGIMIPVGALKVEDIKTQCTDVGKDKFVCPNDALVNDANNAKTLTTAGKIAMGIGGAAFVGGLIWEFVANKPQPQEADKPATGRIRLSPAISPSQTGITIHGTF